MENPGQERAAARSSLMAVEAELRWKRPRRGDHAMVQQRHADLEADAYADSVHLRQDVVQYVVQYVGRAVRELEPAHRAQPDADVRIGRRPGSRSRGASGDSLRVGPLRNHCGVRGRNVDRVEFLCGFPQSSGGRSHKVRPTRGSRSHDCGSATDEFDGEGSGQ